MSISHLARALGAQPLELFGRLLLCIVLDCKYMCVYIYTYIYTTTSNNIFSCVHIYIYIYMYMYVYIYIYILYTYMVSSCIVLHVLDWVALLGCIVLNCDCVVLDCVELYCIVLNCTVLHWIVLYCIGLCWIVPYCSGLYCVELYRTVSNCIVIALCLYCIDLYCAVFYSPSWPRRWRRRPAARGTSPGPRAFSAPDVRRTPLLWLSLFIFVAICCLCLSFLVFS